MKIYVVDRLQHQVAGQYLNSVSTLLYTDNSESGEGAKLPTKPPRRRIGTNAGRSGCNMEDIFVYGKMSLTGSMCLIRPFTAITRRLGPTSPKSLLLKANGREAREARRHLKVPVHKGGVCMYRTSERSLVEACCTSSSTFLQERDTASNRSFAYEQDACIILIHNSPLRMPCYRSP